MKYSLRDYQVTGKNQIYQKIRSGNKKTIYWMGTGLGKGLAMSDFANDCLLVGKKCLVVMRRTNLVNQTRANFEKYHGHDVGVIMGGAKWEHKSIMICSIDTLRNRIKSVEYDFLKEFDLILVDECHDTNSNTYQTLFTWLGNKTYIGFTATPFTVGGKSLVFWQDIVQPITPKEAMERGFSVPDIYYTPVCQINTANLVLNCGDFSASDIYERAKDSVIVGDIVKEWVRLGEMRPTMMFCVNKQHSMIMTEAFNQAGFKFKHIDDSTSAKERELIISELEAGLINGISSVETMTTGVDIPCVSCLIEARPTWSEVLIVQMWGRGLRPFKICGTCGHKNGAEMVCGKCGSDSFSFVKQNCIILGHAGNAQRHGEIYSQRYAKLFHKDGEEKKKKIYDSDEIKIRVCEKCFRSYSPSRECCPSCKWVNEKTVQYKEKSGALVLLDPESARKIMLSSLMVTLDQLRKREKWYNWKWPFLWIQFHRQCGDRVFEFQKELGFTDKEKWIMKNANNK